jgi:putative redox protein
MDQQALKELYQKIIKAIETQPGRARASFMAKTELGEGIRCTAKVREFTPLIVDEPPPMGGTDEGMNPVELILAALGTCQEIMYRIYAALMDIPLKKVTVNVQGDLDVRGLFGVGNSIPAGYSNIAFETIVESEADEESLKKLVAVVEARCPVLDTLSRPVEITGTAFVKKKGRKKRIC